MGSCKDCAGGCCNSCGGELVLSAEEIALLRALGQYSFLPVARKADDMTPVYREDQTHSQEAYSMAIQLLEKKQLIYLEYTPLAGANMQAYVGYPVHGSMGLTGRGLAVLELLELQGAADE